MLISDDKIDGASLNSPYINNIHLRRVCECVCALVSALMHHLRPLSARSKCCNHQSVIGIEQLIHATGGLLQAIAIVWSNEMQVDALGKNAGYGITSSKP